MRQVSERDGDIPVGLLYLITKLKYTEKATGLKLSGFSCVFRYPCRSFFPHSWVAVARNETGLTVSIN